MKSEMIFRNVNEIKVTFTEWLHPERIEISKKTDKIEAFEYFVTKVYDMMGKIVYQTLLDNFHYVKELIKLILGY